MSSVSAYICPYHLSVDLTESPYQQYKEFLSYLKQLSTLLPTTDFQRMLILLSDDEQLQEEVGVQLRHVVRVLTERYINKDLFYFLQMKTI